jgi:membrane protease YdiL (CAAX protease family)
VVAFLVVMFGLTWLPASFLPELWSVGEPAATRLLRASVLYAGLMTFQPIIALAVVRRWFDGGPVDYGLRQTSGRWQLMAIVGPMVLAGLATGFALVIDGAEQTTTAALRPALEPGLASTSGSVLLAFGFLGVICMLWVQAMTEEFGWRGYVLPRLMQALGPVPGLLVHGAVWGVWYAPVFLIASGTDPSSLARCGEFVVTCSLLGVVLGWVRIRARSVYATATVNAVLTIVAALPLVLQGSAAARAAIYLPTGWLPLALAAALVLLGPDRAAIRDFAARR